MPDRESRKFLPSSLPLPLAPKVMPMGSREESEETIYQTKTKQEFFFFGEGIFILKWDSSAHTPGYILGKQHHCVVITTQTAEAAESKGWKCLHMSVAVSHRKENPLGEYLR